MNDEAVLVSNALASSPPKLVVHPDQVAFFSRALLARLTLQIPLKVNKE